MYCRCRLGVQSIKRYTVNTVVSIINSPFFFSFLSFFTFFFSCLLQEPSGNVFLHVKSSKIFHAAVLSMECRFGRTLRAPWSCRLIWPRHRIMMISPNEGLPCCHSHSTSVFTQAGKKMPPSVIHEWIQDVGAILKVELRTICLLDKFNFHIVGLFCCCWVLFLHRTLPIILHVGKCILARICQCPRTEYEFSFSGCYWRTRTGGCFWFGFPDQFSLMGLFVCFKSPFYSEPVQSSNICLLSTNIQMYNIKNILH